MPTAHGRPVRAGELISRLPRRARRFTAAVVAVAFFAIAAVPAAASDHDVRDRQRSVKQKRAEVAAQVDVLRASERELASALDAVERNLRAQQAAVADARRAADAAEAAVKTARAREAAAEQALSETQARMKSLAVQTYVRGGTQRGFATMQSRSLAEAARRQAYFDVAVDDFGALEGQLRSEREDVTIARGEAEAASAAAEKRRATAEGRLRDYESAQRDKQRLAASVEARLERTLAEAASLESVDKALSAELVRRQAELARRVRDSARAPARASRSSVRSGSVQLTTVRGIVVNVEIADGLERLLAAAEADGFALSGGGYRSSEGQIAARRANCGTSDYDVYEKPASQCNPPTARPGQSMHEQGLAIDFTSGGRLISSRSNPAFRWLSANANRFGLYNLPAEAWHWSSNGQ